MSVYPFKCNTSRSAAAEKEIMAHTCKVLCHIPLPYLDMQQQRAQKGNRPTLHTSETTDSSKGYMLQEVQGSIAPGQAPKPAEKGSLHTHCLH